MSSIDHIGAYSITHTKLQTAHSESGREKNETGLHHNTRKEREHRQQISAERGAPFFASECVYVRASVYV